MGGHRQHDGMATPALPLPESAGDFKPIHAGHLAVHENGIEAPGFESIQGRRPVRNADHLVAQAPQVKVRHPPVGGIVIHHQHLAPLSLGTAFLQAEHLPQGMTQPGASAGFGNIGATARSPSPFRRGQGADAHQEHHGKPQGLGAGQAGNRIRFPDGPPQQQHRCLPCQGTGAFQSRFEGGKGRELQVPGLKGGLQRSPGSGMLFADQHMGAGRQGFPDPRLRSGSEGCDAVEAGAFPDFALHLDGAAHAGEDAVADGQPQSAASEAPGGGPFGLREGVEQVFLGFGSNADAGVTDFQVERPSSLGPWHGTGPQDHFPFEGEFQSVPQQVHGHLTQAGRVAHDLVGHVRSELADQFQALALGRLREEPQGLLQFANGIERDAFQFHAPGFDAAEIQHLIENGQQALARTVDGFRKLLLAGRGGGFDEHAGHADDPVQRRTDLVAEGGQEQALGLVGLHGLLPGDFQLAHRLGQVAGPFLDLDLQGFVPPPQGPQADADGQGHQPCQPQTHEQAGPPGGPWRRQHRDGQGQGHGLVPGRIPGPDPEGVGPGRQGREFPLALLGPGTRLVLQPFHLGAVTVVLFPEVAEQRVGKGQAGLPPADLDRLILSQSPGSGSDPFEVEGFDGAIRFLLTGIVDGGARHGARPDAPLAVHHGTALGAAVAGKPIPRCEMAEREARGIGVGRQPKDPALGEHVGPPHPIRLEGIDDVRAHLGHGFPGQRRTIQGSPEESVIGPGPDPGASLGILLLQQTPDPVVAQSIRSRRLGPGTAIENLDPLSPGSHENTPIPHLADHAHDGLRQVPGPFGVAPVLPFEPRRALAGSNPDLAVSFGGPDLLDGIDPCVRQPVLQPIAAGPPAFVPKHAARAGSHPEHRPIRGPGFQQAQDLAIRDALPGSKGFPATAPEPGQPSPQGAGVVGLPIAALHQGEDEVLRHPNPGVQGGPATPGVADQSAVGADPKNGLGSGPRLHPQTADRGSGESPFQSHEVPAALLQVGQTAVHANPQARALARRITGHQGIHGIQRQPFPGSHRHKPAPLQPGQTAIGTDPDFVAPFGRWKGFQGPDLGRGQPLRRAEPRPGTALKASQAALRADPEHIRPGLPVEAGDGGQVPIIRNPPGRPEAAIPDPESVVRAREHPPSGQLAEGGNPPGVHGRVDPVHRPAPILVLESPAHGPAEPQAAVGEALRSPHPQAVAGALGADRLPGAAVVAGRTVLSGHPQVAFRVHHDAFDGVLGQPILVREQALGGTPQVHGIGLGRAGQHPERPGQEPEPAQEPPWGTKHTEPQLYASGRRRFP
ncbi:MAG: hypothetical protein BWY56_01722 [Acidobacteria bacterium ADurb.Bin340]|nr:MAG: hypothetical protein BWY56_01722 [Acidobacteria bacterium ADurb.Bin340]